MRGGWIIMNINQHTFIISKLEEIGRSVLKVNSPTINTYFNAITTSFLSTAQYHMNEFIVLNMILSMRKLCVLSIDQFLDMYQGTIVNLDDIIDLTRKLETVADDIMKKFIISGTDPNEVLIYEYVSEKSALKKINEIRMIKCNV